MSRATGGALKPSGLARLTILPKRECPKDDVVEGVEGVVRVVGRIVDIPPPPPA